MQPKNLLMIAAAALVLLAAPLSFGLHTDTPQVAATKIPPSAPAQPDVAGAAAAPASAASDGLEQAVIPPATALQLNEARQQQLLLLQMHRQLASAEAGNAWLPWLGLAVLGLLGLSVWLAVQLRRLRHRYHLQALRASALAQAHADAVADSGSGSGSGSQDLAASGRRPLFSAPAPLLTGSLTGQRSAQAPLATDAAGADFGLSSPRALAANWAPLSGAAMPVNSFSSSTGAAAPRPVSVEELLDLEQQVDFFIVLGQEQAAVDLLLSHVRATGGSSALPYFKLLQIYRQQGDEEAYERTRDRFNQRFNARAPDWQGDLAAGLCLEHYPAVVARLQQAWPLPLQAVAELESLMLRRADLEPFDLPAFHDILTLHALVRDLPDMPVSPPAAALLPAAWAAASSTSVVDAVDLLLPLDDAPTENTVPRPRMAESGEFARAMLADWVLSRAAHRLPASGSEEDAQACTEASSSTDKLDLDLSDFGPAPREFTRPAAFTDVDMRRDNRRSDLAAFDDSDLLPPSITRR